MSSLKQSSSDTTDPSTTTTPNLDLKWKDIENSIKELENLELLPLVLDVIDDVNSGKILPKDVESSAGTIKVRINKAREILKNIHGLSETPEERAKRVEYLNTNIKIKKNLLIKYRSLINERIALDDGEVKFELNDKDELITDVGDENDENDNKSEIQPEEKTKVINKEQSNTVQPPPSTDLDNDIQME